MNVPLAAALLLAVFGLTAGAQPPAAGQPPPAAGAGQPPAAGATLPAAQNESEGDIYPEARANANSLREAWEKLDTKNLAEVNGLLKTKVCYDKRISGLLSRAQEALDAWLAAERSYWTAWNEHDTKRVSEQQKSLKSMEADLARLAELVESDKQDREQLMHQKANLENNVKTETIKKEIDNLITEIQGSDARLTEDEKQFNDNTTKYNNMQTMISAELVNIRQNISRLDAYAINMHAIYEKQNEAAQEICAAKQPTTKPALPQKKGGGQ
jgi:hypothetical protein